MLLAIDVGNTNIVLGLYDGVGDDAPLVRDWRMRTDARMTADELALTMRGLLGEYADKITGISALSTVPAVLRELRVMLGRYYDAVPKVLVEPGVQDRRAAARRQPEGGGLGPRDQHAGRAPPLRDLVHRGRLRHVHEHRRDLRHAASSSAARWRPASRSRSTRSPPVPPSCARSSWSGRAT